MRDRDMPMEPPGRIVLLNGPPRAGKSSIVTAIQDSFEGVWMNIGLDRFKAMTPERYQPGIGLRPGGERPDLEPVVAKLYAGLYASIAAHSRLGVNVVADVVHHDAYSRSLGILPGCARMLIDLPVWLVGVRCPIDVIQERRAATWGARFAYAEDGSVFEPVRRFQTAVHAPGVYDLEVDTSKMSPEACAQVIRLHLETGPPPRAIERLAIEGADLPGSS